MNQYFNDSAGVGDDGEEDARGPWNEGGDWEIVEAPELKEGAENLKSAQAGNGKSGKTSGGKGVEPESRSTFAAKTKKSG